MRHEFSAKTKRAAYERSKGFCERCSAPLAPGNIIYDHDDPDYFSGDNSLENCVCCCKNCDGIKTPQDQKNIGRARRVNLKHIGAKKQKYKWGYGKNDKHKKKVNGAVVLR